MRLLRGKSSRKVEWNHADVTSFDKLTISPTIKHMNNNLPLESTDKTDKFKTRISEK